jgi:hypothetical protein
VQPVDPGRFPPADAGGCTPTGQPFQSVEGGEAGEGDQEDREVEQWRGLDDGIEASPIASLPSADSGSRWRKT